MSTISNLRSALVQFGFRLLYNELAFTYDVVSQMVSLGAWSCWQYAALRHLDIPSSANVLELAFGTGNLQLALTERGYHPFGYDLSPYMAQITTKKLQRHGYRARLVRGVAQQLPFRAQIFDAIICTFPTNFIFEPSTMIEIHRILARRGRFIAVLNGTLTGNGLLESGIEWLYKITGQRGDLEISMDKFFDSYGFEIIISLEDCPRSKALVIKASKKD